MTDLQRVAKLEVKHGRWQLFKAATRDVCDVLHRRPTYLARMHLEPSILSDLRPLLSCIRCKSDAHVFE